MATSPRRQPEPAAHQQRQQSTSPVSKKGKKKSRASQQPAPEGEEEAVEFEIEEEQVLKLMDFSGKGYDEVLSALMKNKGNTDQTVEDLLFGTVVLEAN
eukprot:m51a1_g13255 hypothetical protein (99) ;mRNA; f:351-759